MRRPAKVLMVREAWKRIFPIGPVYVLDAVHRHLPGVTQHLLDVAGLPAGERRRAILDRASALDPDVILYSWRDVHTMLPATEDPETLELAMRARFGRGVGNFARVVASYVRKRLGYEHALRRNFATLRDLRRRHPRARILVGGPVATLYGEHLARELPEGIHFVVGEGEEIVPLLVAGEEPDYDCVLWREGNSIRRGTRATPGFLLEQAPPLDVAYLPTAFPDLHGYLDQPIGIQTKRGCSQRCAFCNSRLLEGARLRYRPVETVLSDLRAFRALGARTFWFTDSQFISTDRCAAYARDLLSRLAAERLGVRWSGYIRIDRADDDLCRAFVASGLEPLELSLTTGSQQVNDGLKLGFQVEDALAGCERLRAAGYGGDVIVNYSLNAPGETPDSLRETVATHRRIERIFGAGRVRPEIFYLAISPDTELADHAVRTGYAPAPSPGANPLKLTLESARYDIYDPEPLASVIGRLLLRAYAEKRPASRYLMEHLEEALAARTAKEARA